MRTRGFTLIETLIVVTMIAILAAIALPRVRIEQAQVDAAARTVTSALMHARADAVARGHNVLVVFDTTNEVVRTIWDTNNNGRFDSGEHTRPAMLAERVAFGRGAGIPAFEGASSSLPSMQTLNGMPMLVLQRNGALDRGGVLYLTSQRGMAGQGTVDSRALRLDRATGRARVYLYSATGWRLQ